MIQEHTTRQGGDGFEAGRAAYMAGGDLFEAAEIHDMDKERIARRATSERDEAS
jgi:hypothetical protein